MAQSQEPPGLRRDLDLPLRKHPSPMRDDIFDVEAPDVGSPRWNMSEYQAYGVALHSEKKAYEFYDEALSSVIKAGLKLAIWLSTRL